MQQAMSSQAPKKIPASAGRDSILAAFARDGAVIIQNFLSLDEVTRFNTEIQPVLDTTATGKTSDQLVAEGGDFMDAQTKRVMNIAKLSKTFREEITYGQRTAPHARRGGVLRPSQFRILVQLHTDH
ncbi:hypothetical protein BJX99DRAFT_239428 [Aspergillus californicus]